MSMPKIATENLREGCILDPVLRTRRFHFECKSWGPGSGGVFASRSYINSNRRFEIHVRCALGLVTSHFDGVSLTRNEYMSTVLGADGGNKYPGFSDDPRERFRGLAFDLANFATGFLTGNVHESKRCVTEAEPWKRTAGYARLP
jgi:hypothetical protein